jgi:hypothetical protein
VVADEVAKIKLAKQRLSNPDKIIDVIESGELQNGQSFAVFPKGKPLSNNRVVGEWQKRRLMPPVLLWLRSIAADASPPEAGASDEYTASLNALIRVPGLSSRVKDAAALGLELLNTELVRFCPMHSDLWTGNLIQMPGGDFRVIDWRGFQPHGYGFFDLVTLCRFLSISQREFRKELDAHEKLLSTNDEGAVMTMLAGCGHVFRHLDRFPIERFVQLTESMFGYLRRVID